MCQLAEPYGLVGARAIVAEEAQTLTTIIAQKEAELQCDESRDEPRSSCDDPRAQSSSPDLQAVFEEIMADCSPVEGGNFSLDGNLGWHSRQELSLEFFQPHKTNEITGPLSPAIAWTPEPLYDPNLVTELSQRPGRFEYGKELNERTVLDTDRVPMQRATLSQQLLGVDYVVSPAPIVTTCNSSADTEISLFDIINRLPSATTPSALNHENEMLRNQVVVTDNGSYSVSLGAQTSPPLLAQLSQTNLTGQLEQSPKENLNLDRQSKSRKQHQLEKRSDRELRVTPGTTRRLSSAKLSRSLGSCQKRTSDRAVGPEQLDRIDSLTQLRTLLNLSNDRSGMYKNLPLPVEVYNSLSARATDQKADRILLLTRLFYAIASPQAFEQLQDALKMARQRLCLHNRILVRDLLSTMHNLDLLESASSLSHILRRIYLVQLLEYRLKLEEKHRNADLVVRQHKRRRKYDLDNIDLVKMGVGKAQDSPRASKVGEKRGMRSASQALTDMVAALHPRSDSSISVSGTPNSTTCKRNLSKLKSRLSCARNWFKFDQGFSRGILALIPSGTDWGVSIDQ